MFPDNFLFTESINILAMVILGGIGSLAGVILGAALIVALPEVFRDFALYRLLAFGLADGADDLPPEGLLVRRARAAQNAPMPPLSWRRRRSPERAQVSPPGRSPPAVTGAEDDGELTPVGRK